MIDQAEERVHRIGQPSDVTVRYLLGAGTLDELLWPVLVRKAVVLNEALEGQPGAISLAADAMRGAGSTQTTDGADDACTQEIQVVSQTNHPSYSSQT